jgi:DNA-binding NtrC family response regulator
MANILALDDVPDAARLIKRILEPQGHTVVVFTEEEDALTHARKHHVDLAILDIKLKKMTGVEVLGQLKQIHPDVKAIMLTGYPTMETAQESLKLGAGDYCVKPIDVDGLEEKVNALLAGATPASSE